MIHRKVLSETEGRLAMSDGEFPASVRESSRFVAVVLTQSWCPDWTWMRGWLERQAKNREPEDLDIHVYEFEYNKISFFDEFMLFKERNFRNSLIPYVRYYVGGEFVGDSNQVSPEKFFARFRGAVGAAD